MFLMSCQDGPDSAAVTLHVTLWLLQRNLELALALKLPKGSVWTQMIPNHHWEDPGSKPGANIVSLMSCQDGPDSTAVKLHVTLWLPQRHLEVSLAFKLPKGSVRTQMIPNHHWEDPGSKPGVNIVSLMPCEDGPDSAAVKLHVTL